MGIAELMLSKNDCPLCRQSANIMATGISGVPGNSGTDFYDLECVRCGHFSIKHDVLEELQNPEVRVALSGIAREWTELKRPLEINKDNLQSLINLAPKTFADKKRKLLQSLARKCNTYHYDLPFNSDEDYTYAYVCSSTDYG